MNALVSQPSALTEPSIYGLLAKRSALVGLIVLVFTVFSIATAFLSTPTYEATAVLLPEDNQSTTTNIAAALGSFQSLGSLVGLGRGDSKSTIEAVALLQSRAFAESFITEHDLMPRIFASRWDSSQRNWRASWFSPHPPTLYDAYTVFHRRVLFVSQDQKTGLVTLSVDWRDPTEAAQWANEMVEKINSTMRQRGLTEANASIARLTEQMKESANVELRNAIALSLDEYVKLRVMALVRPEYAFRVIEPAEAPGIYDFIKPLRSLYIVGGPLVGLLFSVFVILTWEFVARERTRALSVR